MEIKEKLDELGRVFEDFKKANNAELAEIKKWGTASTATSERVEKLNSVMDKLEKQIESMQVAMNRSGGAGNQSVEEKEKQAVVDYKNALFSYMRKGDSTKVAELQAWARKAMSVDSDADGGFLVSPELSSEIVKKVFESSPVRQLASVQSISTDSFEILEDLDEASSGWVGETQTRSETNTPTVKKIIIPAHELHASPKASQKVLDDAAINLEAWLQEKVSSKFARDEATAFISGNGVGKPKGILDYGSGDGFGLIERVATAANNALTGDDLIDLQTALKEPYQNNATFLINRARVGGIRKLKGNTSGDYLWQPGLGGGIPPMLLGRPVMYASDLPSAITATTDTVIYGDFKAGYQVVDRVGVRVLRDPFTAKPHVLFYTTKRVGGGVKNFEALKVLRIKT